MLRHFKKAAVGLAAASLLPSASAFSLMGIEPVWQTATLGYQLGSDLGGPMNLGEEYRRQTPIVTYAFDESFLNYFGQRGVEEVEKAVAILNALPPYSSMTDDYVRSLPLRTADENYRAGALNLLDMKSYAMSFLVETLGLTCPERYAWTLRGRTVINNIPYYTTIKRNFDPVTYEPSSFVNGVMLSYTILQTYTTPTYEAVEFTVDPDVEAGGALVSLATLNGGTVSWIGVNAVQAPGVFYKAPTRDDIGGLRYIYRTQNMNVENLPANTVQAPLGALGNYIYDPRLPGAGSPGDGGGSPWAQPGTGTTTGTNTATTNVTSNPFPLVSQAVRPGLDKVQFVRVNYDSMVGLWNPLVNRYEDRVVTNGVMSKQTLDRTLTQPDVIFSAGDLGISAAGVPFLSAHSIAMTSNDGINGSYALDGPGVIGGASAVITFSKLGPWTFNVNEGSSEATATIGAIWGAFDDTTKDPIVFPSWVSIADLEALVFSNQIEANPWGSPFVQAVIQNNTGGTTDTGGTGDTTDTGGGTTDTGSTDTGG